jgi:hypothetical protein
MMNRHFAPSLLLGITLTLTAVLLAADKELPLFEPGPDGKVEIFNGKDLTGWDAEAKYWSVQNGELVGKATEAKHPYSYATTTRSVGDFRLTLQVKLTPNSENSGIQFRSIRSAEREMKGPQADIGKGWWGHLYDEHGKALLTKKSGDQWVKENDWNTYEILAVGSKIRTAINGHLCTDIDDPDLRSRGVIGFQLHSGGPQEVRFKEIKLELNPKFELATVKADR